MVGDSHKEGHPAGIMTKTADAILKNSAGYFALLVGIILGAGIVGAAAWGYFGEKMQSSALDVLDPTGRAAFKRSPRYLSKSWQG